MAVHCTHIRPVEHSKPARSVEHDAETRINTRTPHYVLLLQVLVFPVSGLWNQEARGASPLGVLRASSPGACVGRTSPVARHPASGIRHPASCRPLQGVLHPAGRCKASCVLQAVARRPASGWLVVGWWLAGGWLVVGWWLAGGWLVVGWAGWLVVGWLAGLGWAGGWLVVGWWLVGGWLVGGWLVHATGTLH